MVANLEIQSVLALDTQEASKKLQQVLSDTKPPVHALDLDTSKVAKKLSEVNQSASNVKLNPLIDTKGIDSLIAQLSSIKTSAIAVSTIVDNSDVNALIGQLEKLRSQSELKLKLSSEAKDITIGNDGTKHGAEIAAIAKQQSELTKESIREQKNTQSTIKQESAASFKNLVKQGIGKSIGTAAKNAAFSTFKIDSNQLEKSLKRILPNAAMIGRDFRGYFTGLSGKDAESSPIKSLRKNLIEDLAESTSGVDSFFEAAIKFKDLASENSFKTFVNDTKQVGNEIKDWGQVLDALGLSASKLKDSFLTSETVSTTKNSAYNKLSPLIAKRKDSVQSDRLVNVFARAEELIGQDVANVEEDAVAIARSTQNVLAALTDSTEELFLTIGGYTDDLEKGAKNAENINDQFRKKGNLGKKRAVGISGLDTAITATEGSQSPMFSLLRPNIRGYSKDAEEIAAQAIAALIKNPKVQIKILGESGGGLPAQEAIEILNKAGFGDRVSGIGTGTPIFRGRTANPKNFTPYLGVNDKEYVGKYVTEGADWIPVDKRILAKNPRKSQSMKGLSGHFLHDYLKQQEVREFVYGDGKGKSQKNATPREVKDLRQKLIDGILSGASMDALESIKKFENDTRIVGNSTELFVELKKDISKFEKDVEKGALDYLDSVGEHIKTMSQDIPMALESGDVEFIRNIKQYAAVLQVGMSKLGVESSGLTKEYILKLQKDLNTVVSGLPSNSSPEVIKTNYHLTQLKQVIGSLEKESPSDSLDYLQDWYEYLDRQSEVLSEIEDEDGKSAVEKDLLEQKQYIEKLIKLKRNQDLLIKSGNEIENRLPDGKDFVNSKSFQESVLSGNNKALDRLNKADEAIASLESQKSDDDDLNRAISQQIAEMQDIKRVYALEGRINDAISYLSQLEPSNAAPLLAELEKSLKTDFSKGVKYEFDNEFTQDVRKILQSQIKVVKTARRLALLDVEFSASDLIANPSQYFQTIKDSSLEKAKESAKKRSLDAAQKVAIAAQNTVENFVDDLKDKLLEAAKIIQSKAIGGDSNANLLPGDKGSAITLSGAGQSMLARSAVDTLAIAKGTYATLQKIEQAIFAIVPGLNVAKSVTQVAAPVIGGAALTSMHPELAHLAKLSAHELAQVIEPLIMASRSGLANLAGDAVANLPGIGGASRAIIQSLINNPVLNTQVASGAGAVLSYGAIGGGTKAIAGAGARLAGRKAYQALPESMQRELSPDAIAAFDRLVADRQSEIKQLASGLNKQIALLKGSDDPVDSQKLLAGYQQIRTEIAELNTAVGSSSRSALKLTRDRLKELKGIEKSLGKVINDAVTRVKSGTQSLFGVEISDNTDFATKSSFRKAIKQYRQDIINYRAALDKKILKGIAFDSDFEAGEELAKRGSAIASSLKNQGGFNKEARSLADVSKTLQSRIPNDPNRVKAGQDAVNGILEGSNQKLAQVFIHGRGIGKELLKGFKDELGIQSPSKEFEKQGKNVADGIDKGVSNNLSEISESGDRAGDKFVESYKKSIASIKNSIKGIDKIALSKDAIVNGLGTAANIAVHSQTKIPGSGLAAEYVVSTATRKAINDIESVIQATSKVLGSEVDQSTSYLDKFNQLIKESTSIAKSKSKLTRSQIDGDSVGFAIGNTAAIASQAIGAKIPFVGAVASAAVSKQAIAIRNQILEQANPGLVIRNLAAGITKGVSQQSGVVNKEGHAIASHLARGVNDELGIRSPSTWGESRVFWIAKGAAKGVLKSAAMLSDTGLRISNKIIDGFDNSRVNTVGIDHVDEITARIQSNLRKAESAIAAGNRRLDRVDRSTGVSTRPIELTQDASLKNSTSQIRKTIESVRNELKSIALESTIKEAKKSSAASKDLLANLNTTLTEGKNATAKIKQATSAIAVLEANRANFIKSMSSLKGADAIAAKAVVNRIQSQIDNEKSKVDALKRHRDEAVKLLPIYSQLKKLQADLQKAIAGQDTKTINRINREINQVFKSLNQSPPTNVGGFIGKIQDQLDKVGLNLKNVKRTILGLAGLAVGSMFVGDIGSTIRDLGEVAVRFEQIKTRMNFATGGAKEGAAAFEFVSDRAKALKIDIESAASGYAQLAASTKNSEALRGSTNKIFDSIVQAARVSGGTAENTQAAFTAIQQMIAGGTVQLEELRQLGESGGIPDVFGLASESLGMTTAEMKKMVSTGTLLTEDFLPKFSAELTKSTRIGLADSLRTTSAAIQNVKTEFKLLQVAIAETGQGTAKGALNGVASSLAFIRENLDKIIPVLQASALLIATALLPAAIGLAKTVGGFLLNGLMQVVSQIAAVQGGATLATIALKALGTAGLAIGAVVVVQQVAAAYMSLSNAGKEARDAVKGINDVGIELQKTLDGIKNKKITVELATEVTGKNKEAIAKSMNLIQKAVNWTFEDQSWFTDYQEAAESRINTAATEAIAANQKVQRQMQDSLNQDGGLTDASTESLEAFVNALDTKSQFLANTASTVTDPKLFTDLNTEIAENDRLLEIYNRELAKRNGLELNLSKIMGQKSVAVTNATKTEIDGIKSIDESILKSGDFKKDVELEKLGFTKNRIAAELEAEKIALVQIKELAIAQGKIDKYSGEMTDPKQLEEYKKTEAKIVELTRSAVENRQAILAKETEQKIAEYDRYTKAIEDRVNDYLQDAAIADKERLIEIQSLYNDDKLSKEQLEDFKAKSSRDRIKEELEMEQSKLSDLESFKSDEKSVIEQNEDAIASSREKILDLTLQSLEQEKEAEEKTINYISELRDKASDALEKRLSRLQALYQTESQLLSDKSTAQNRLRELEVGQLKKALELRRQLNSDELDPSERKLALTELLSLGIKGKTDEMSILNQIQQKEDAIAKSKIESLQVQQKYQQKQLELEILQLQVSTQKDELEAKKAVNDAQKDVNTAEAKVAAATTPEELKSALTEYDLAKSSLKLAADQLELSEKQRDSLGKTIRLKKEILELNQAGDRAELGITNQDQRSELNKEKRSARESRSRFLKQNDPSRDISNYLNRSEFVEQKVGDRKAKFESSGKEFNEESEKSYRAKLERDYRVSQSQRDFSTRRNLQGDGFSVTAPSVAVDAILNKVKGLFVPDSIKSPERTVEIGDRVTTDPGMLKILQSIESKLITPTVVNVKNDNSFINQYDRSGTDSMLDKVRSEIVEGINAIARNPGQFAR